MLVGDGLDGGDLVGSRRIQLVSHADGLALDGVFGSAGHVRRLILEWRSCRGGGRVGEDVLGEIQVRRPFDRRLVLGPAIGVHALQRQRESPALRVDFGAFVDLDGMDGLIHISELSWSHVNHPSEVLEIGQTVKVKVLDIDRERQRISLGLKQTQSDPWQQVLEQHKEGDVVEGKVTKVVTFGAFVEILPGVEGLVHISELAQHHVENPREVVSQGDTVPVLILEVDAERRRLSLSLKRVDADRRAESEGPIEGTPHLDLSEDVFRDSASAPLAPELDAPPAAAEEAVEREAVAPGDEIDPAAADEAPAPADEASAPVEPVSDEH